MRKSQSHSTASRLRCRAFSLTEMLVTFGVIALLSALIFPALQHARQKALEAQCVGKLRMIGQGIHLFCQDNEGRLPYLGTAVPDSWWHRKIFTYLTDAQDWEFVDKAGKMFVCPADPAPLQNVISYGFNRRLAGLRLQSISNNCLFVAESEGTDITANGSSVVGFKTNHGDQGQVLFKDGSVGRYHELPPPSKEPNLWNANP